MTARFNQNAPRPEDFFGQALISQQGIGRSGQQRWGSMSKAGISCSLP